MVGFGVGYWWVGSRLANCNFVLGRVEELDHMKGNFTDRSGLFAAAESGFSGAWMLGEREMGGGLLDGKVVR